MSLRLVRCPYCDKRFNLTGIAPGTRLRCAGCAAVLAVPGADPRLSRHPRSIILRVMVGTAAGILAVAGAWWILRSSASVDVPLSPPPEIVHLSTPGDEPPQGTTTSIMDDPVSKAMTSILNEFGSHLLFSPHVKPYLVSLERSDRYIGKDLVQEYAGRLETLHLSFRREFGEELKLPPVDGVLTVVILNSRESFDRYCEAQDKRKMATAIKGIYEYGRRRIVTYHDFNAPYEVLLHEGAHQLVHYYTLRETDGRKVPSAYWFQEGLGTYFEGFRRRGDGEIILDPGLGNMRLPVLKQTLLQQDRRDFVPLTMLVGMTVDEFWEWFERESLNEPAEATRKAQLYYAESWAFVHFLRRTSSAHRKVFEEYFRHEIAGTASKAAFEDLVRNELGIDLPQLEDQFVKHIQGLR
jgi:hypothetical protein